MQRGFLYVEMPLQGTGCYLSLCNKWRQSLPGTQSCFNAELSIAEQTASFDAMRLCIHCEAVHPALYWHKAANFQQILLLAVFCSNTITCHNWYSPLNYSSQLICDSVHLCHDSDAVLPTHQNFRLVSRKLLSIKFDPESENVMWRCPDAVARMGYCWCMLQSHEYQCWVLETMTLVSIIDRHLEKPTHLWGLIKKFLACARWQNIESSDSHVMTVHHLLHCMNCVAVCKSPQVLLLHTVTWFTDSPQWRVFLKSH